jgi:hypothetical protein
MNKKITKSQASLVLAMPIFMLPLLVLLPLYASLVLLIVYFAFVNLGKKSESGQSQLLSSLLVLLITSAIVIATNSTITNNTTGMFSEVLESNVIEKTSTVQVWANTFIDVQGSKARLLMDNGSAITGQEILAYYNEELLQKLITDEDGYVEFNNVTNLVYLGNESLFLNPSFAEIRHVNYTQPVCSKTY